MYVGAYKVGAGKIYTLNSSLFLKMHIKNKGCRSMFEKADTVP